MKRLVSVLTAVFFMTGMALGQSGNNATTTQEGSNNDASVVQEGGNQKATVNQEEDQNVATVNQFTDNNGKQTATVIQKGDAVGGNTATIDMDQISSGDNYENTANIEQVGDYNTSYQKVYAPSNSSGLNLSGKQKGNHNTLNQQIHNGYTNDFNATQKGDYNKARQYMSGAHNNSGDISQVGDYNKAVQVLSGSNNGYNGIMAIEQDGNYNDAKQVFESTGSWTYNNSGLINQYGNSNYARQNVVGWRTDATILQGSEEDGKRYDYNKAWQNVDGTQNTVYIRQQGNRNWTKQIVEGDKNNVSLSHHEGSYNTGRQTIDGNDNTVQAVIAGSNNNSYQKADGNDNTQYYSATNHVKYNDVRIVQDGSDNYSHNNVRTNGIDNDLNVLQEGNENNLVTKQAQGSHNSILVRQYGDSNLAGKHPFKKNIGILQNGSYNEATLKQFNGNQKANISQMGDGNWARTIQK